MRKVFISYSRADESIVKRICQDLDLRDISYWRDVKEIKIGDSISEKIEEGLQDSSYFCLCLSKASVKRAWVIREYRTALNIQLSKSSETMRILPLLLEKCDIPDLLLDIRYADFTDSYVSGMRQLFESLGLPNGLTRIRTFDVPYADLIAHIEKTESLESFLEAAKAKKRSDLDHSWASRMFSRLEQGIKSTKKQVEYIMGLGRDTVMLMTEDQPVESAEKCHVLFLPRIRIFSGYGFISDDMVDPYIQAKEGLWEFLENLILYRDQIQSRRVFLLPESYIKEGESYPDGMWEDEIDNKPLRARLESKRVNER